jgi:hypothetical protein
MSQTTTPDYFEFGMALAKGQIEKRLRRVDIEQALTDTARALSQLDRARGLLVDPFDRLSAEDQAAYRRRAIHAGMVSTHHLTASQAVQMEAQREAAICWQDMHGEDLPDAVIEMVRAIGTVALVAYPKALEREFNVAAVIDGLCPTCTQPLRERIDYDRLMCGACCEGQETGR